MSYKFIDLYAGLGGFHKALSDLGHKCVYACEQNSTLREFYQKNFPDTPISSDVLAIEPEILPEFDVLCAGFPCQPFSRAGNRLGFDDPRGNHFFKIAQIVSKRRPRFIFLENVETLKRHDSGHTFNTIFTELTRLDYTVRFDTLSPHEFNIPHHRRRLFIVCEDNRLGNGLVNFQFPLKRQFETSVQNYLLDDFQGLDNENLELSEVRRKALDLWKQFIENFPKPKALPTFPIWSFEWGADYPFEELYNGDINQKDLVGYKGSFGKEINKEAIERIEDYIPRYAFNAGSSCMPSWKVRYIEQNRMFYSRFKDFIDDFLEQGTLYELNFSDQKLEWNCNGCSNTIDDKIIQFRPSGIRIKKDNWIPALNTINTQNVFLPKYNRKISIIELMRFQGFNLKYFPDIEGNKYFSKGGSKALGNAVNVDLIKLISKELLKP